MYVYTHYKKEHIARVLLAHPRHRKGGHRTPSPCTTHSELFKYIIQAAGASAFAPIANASEDPPAALSPATTSIRSRHCSPPLPLVPLPPPRCWDDCLLGGALSKLMKSNQSVAGFGLWGPPKQQHCHLLHSPDIEAVIPAFDLDLREGHIFVLHPGSRILKISC